ncbi:uncharacterized protein LOC134192941 [Corticium candelabrum]|uniref:uncharacterized protein LOC134192941 n=1 Tax=Corticium candelabrum TaxID=121492 RepID=UPI002E25AD6E|nr:uncharacterized protein LOC134192941 [Corticium candelabrum]
MERDGPALAGGPRQPILYISYSDDSDVHVKQVANFADWLSRNGCDVRLRLRRQQPMLEQGLETWTETEVLAADFVVLVCTKFYRQDADRADGGQVKHEVDLVKQRLGGNRIYKPFLPVLFPESTADDVPRCVFQSAHYQYSEGLEPDNLLFHVYGKEKLELRQGGAPELKPMIVGDNSSYGVTSHGQDAAREDLSHDHVVTCDEIRQVYKKVSHKWKSVARELGPAPLFDWQIDQIQSRERDDDARCYEMLRVWVENNKLGGGAKVFELIRVLTEPDIGLVDAAMAAFSPNLVTQCQRHFSSGR